MQEQSIEQVSIEDTNEVLEICTQSLLSTKRKKGLSDKEIESQGFLVYPITKADIIAASQDPKRHIFLVAKYQKKIYGYIYGIDFALYLEQHPNWLASIDFTGDPKILNQKLMYGRQVATIKADHPVFTPLFIEGISRMAQEGYLMNLEEVCEGPLRNDRSLAYHNRVFKMQRLGGWVDPQGFSWGLYARCH